VIVFSRAGASYVLSLMVCHRQPQELWLHLFVNDTWPAIDQKPRDKFEEARGFGYAPKALRGADFVVEQAAYPRIIHPKVTFTFSGRLGKVYGWFATVGLDGEQVAAERFIGDDSPYNIEVAGDFITITPIIDWGVVKTP
jgi:hypothetical protein